jgi:hypothetical protein
MHLSHSREDEESTMTTQHPRKSSDSKSSESEERQPHRSGQEYEYGETPETGLGDAGVGTDPDRQNARHAPRSGTHLEPVVDDQPAEKSRPRSRGRTAGGNN